MLLLKYRDTDEEQPDCLDYNERIMRSDKSSLFQRSSIQSNFSCLNYNMVNPGPESVGIVIESVSD